MPSSGSRHHLLPCSDSSVLGFILSIPNHVVAIGKIPRGSYYNPRLTHLYWVVNLGTAGGFDRTGMRDRLSPRKRRAQQAVVRFQPDKLDSISEGLLSRR